MIIHAVGKLHVFTGPDDFKGYGYFYGRLYPSGFGLPANLVEEYVLPAAMMHVAIALKRTWDISINYTKRGSSIRKDITVDKNSSETTDCYSLPAIQGHMCWDQLLRCGTWQVFGKTFTKHILHLLTRNSLA